MPPELPTVATTVGKHSGGDGPRQLLPRHKEKLKRRLVLYERITEKVRLFRTFLPVPGDFGFRDRNDCDDGQFPEEV